MKNNITHQATATAALMISSDPEARMRPKPPYSAAFEISEAAYARFPKAFTITELPQPAVVAADSIENYDEHLAAIPEDERGLFDLYVDDRWGDVDAVKGFMNRALETAFGGRHFTVEQGLEHLIIERLYLDNPTYSFTIADGGGKTLDFYSAPQGFEQPISIEARINVHRPALAQGA